MNARVTTSSDEGSVVVPRIPGIAWTSIALWLVLTVAGLFAGAIVGVWVVDVGGVVAFLAGVFLVAFVAAGSPIAARAVVVRRQTARSARRVRRSERAAGR